jgi:hypothetical protein
MPLAIEKLDLFARFEPKDVPCVVNLRPDDVDRPAYQIPSVYPDLSHRIIRTTQEALPNAR